MSERLPSPPVQSLERSQVNPNIIKFQMLPKINKYRFFIRSIKYPVLPTSKEYANPSCSTTHIHIIYVTTEKFKTIQLSPVFPCSSGFYEKCLTKPLFWEINSTVIRVVFAANFAEISAINVNFFIPILFFSRNPSSPFFPSHASAYPLNL